MVRFDINKVCKKTPRKLMWERFNYTRKNILKIGMVVSPEDEDIEYNEQDFGMKEESMIGIGKEIIDPNIVFTDCVSNAPMKVTKPKMIDAYVEMDSLTDNSCTSQKHIIPSAVWEQVIAATGWKFEPGYMMNNFKQSMCNTLDVHFLDAVKKCCFFHWKQEIWIYLLNECKFDCKEIKYALSVGVLDLLTIILQNKVMTKGITFICLLTEDRALNAELTKWDMFWN
eukprot:15346486-Ditylum_brightwellii.AAC.1